MKLHKRIVIALTLLTLLAPVFSVAPQAQAAGGDCFFNKLAGPVTGTGRCSVPGRFGAYGVNDVLTGRDSSGNGSAIKAYVNNKAEFINFIRNNFNGSNVHDQVGAAFIIQEMRSNKDHAWPSNADVQNWVDLMNLSNVKVTRGTDNSVGRTSYYDPSKRNTFYAGHPVVQREVIYVRQDGKLLAEIETACGNMVAGPGVIAPPAWTLEGTSTPNVTVSPGDTVTFKHVVQNTGPDDMDQAMEGYVEWKGSTGGGVINGDVVRQCNDGNGLEADPGADSKKICDSPAFTIPITASPGSQYCQRVAYKPKFRDKADYNYSTKACATVAAAPGDCSGGIQTTTLPIINESFSATLQVSTNNYATAPSGFPTAANAGQFRVQITAVTVPSGASLAGMAVGTTQTLNSSDLTVSNNFTNIIGNKLGQYTVKWNLFKNGVKFFNTDCSGDVHVGSQPYFSVTGGDILSGGMIRSWNDNGAGSSYAGASSQIAALATGNIQDFVTGGGLPGGAGANNTGSGLAFANTSKLGTIYGGGYGVSSFLPNNVTSTQTLAVSADLSGKSGVYHATGPLTIRGTVDTGKTVTIIVDSGNAIIDGSILYGAYGSPSQIPRLNLYVLNGDIIVRHDVSTIHGVYYASRNFYSCGDNAVPSAPVDLSTSATGYTDCQTKLKVYGAVAAGKLVLSRTWGSLHASAGLPAEPAETFVYSPELWLAPADDGTTTGIGQFDYFRSLPPIL